MVIMVVVGVFVMIMAGVFVVVVVLMVVGRLAGSVTKMTVAELRRKNQKTNKKSRQCVT